MSTASDFGRATNRVTSRATAVRSLHTPCYHGGAFFDAIGDGFQTLSRRTHVINADVLDAWFPPAPRVLESLREHLDWVVRTSPPTNGEGLVRAIAAARGVSPECVVVGGGSSDLIFLALPLWLRRESRVLLLDPTYGEYTHVLEHVVGCRVDRLRLERSRSYALHTSELVSAWARQYDLVILVNPNSPTGQHVPASELADALLRAPSSTRVWIDETYVEYVGARESLERLAASSPNIVVCKSMSKVYALSGVRVAYLVGSPDQVAPLRRRTPPWPVGLPGQIAAVRALQSASYYQQRYAETHRLRERLANGLAALGGVEVVPSVANFLLLHLAEYRPPARTVVTECRASGLFLRDAASMSPSLGNRALRIAVKDRATNARMLEILGEVFE